MMLSNEVVADANVGVKLISGIKVDVKLLLSVIRICITIIFVPKALILLQIVRSFVLSVMRKLAPMVAQNSKN
ncbi:MAG: hypothetical protein DDT27_00509 [Dehalococcoidia bacterium]|nr:hypothetical protein [Chloroflexota bacterium]MBT9161966.1 hypothetical protein [Chloroflexota bacterium]